MQRIKTSSFCSLFIHIWTISYFIEQAAQEKEQKESTIENILQKNEDILKRHKMEFI